MEQKINSRIIKTESINWKELQFIQDEDFKEWINDGDKKLIESLVKYQFADPFKVWENEGKIYCLDGKHRWKDLHKVEESGYNVPDLLPATFIACTDIKEAAELVLVYSSAYAKITQDGLFNFINNNNIEWADIKNQVSLPDFSTDRFEQKFDFFGVQDSTNDEDPEFGKDELDIVVKPGDLFQLGNHRLFCGDFKIEEGVALLMDGNKGRIVFTDPPYNLPFNVFTNEKKHKDFAEGVGEMSDVEFSKFLALIMTKSKENTVPGAIHYICMDFRHCWHMTDAARVVYGNPEPKQVCVWNKDMMANGSFYRAKQELVFVFHNDNAMHLWNKDLLDEGGFYKNENELVFIFKNGDAAKHLSHLELKNRIRTNVWNYPSAISTANPDRYELKNHPTPKPTIMIADAIMDTTNEGDIVIDWFVGSGSTLIAAEKTNRVCYATEIEASHVQHIICRYYRYCEKTGREFKFEHINGSLSIKQILQTVTVH